MSTYTEDGDYWHDAWEGSQRALAAMKAELDYIKSGHVDDELYRQLREMKAEVERLRLQLNQANENVRVQGEAYEIAMDSVPGYEG